MHLPECVFLIHGGNYMRKVNKIRLFCFMSSSLHKKEREELLQPIENILKDCGIPVSVHFDRDGYMNIELDPGKEISYEDAHILISEIDSYYDVAEFRYVTADNPTPGTYPHLLIRFKPTAE